MTAEKRKPRDKPVPYRRQAEKPKVKDAPVTPACSTTSHTSSRQNLTLGDWLTVFAYVDAHQAMPQCDVVNHFKSLQSGALTFTQSTLSRKLKERLTLEARIKDNPNALSSKRPRIVTRPDVDRALFLWVRHMEAKGEHVNGPMLKEKRRRFEELFEVPEEEQLSGDGWLAPFRKAYNVREHRRHGEAGSVDLDAVERNRMFGEPPSLDDFLERAEEQEVGDSPKFEGGDEDIVAAVKQQLAEKAGEVIEVESDEEDDPEPEVSRAETLALCQRLEGACLQFAHADSPLTLELLKQLRLFRGQLRHDEQLRGKQTTIDAYFR